MGMMSTHPEGMEGRGERRERQGGEGGNREKSRDRTLTTAKGFSDSMAFSAVTAAVSIGALCSL